MASCINIMLPKFLLCLGLVTIGIAQEVKISGVVKDASGKGVPEAEVKLERINKTVKTDKEGKYSFAPAPVSITVNNTPLNEIATASIQNSALLLNVKKTEEIELIVSRLNGELVFKNRSKYSPGVHQIMNGIQTSEVYLLRIKTSQNQTEIQTKAIAKTEATKFTDTLLVKKDGYLDYRIIISNADTNSFDVSLLPSAGTVVDADGNVYQSVKLGNQIWTTSNLKTTKYNDGSSIPLVEETDKWKKLSTPAFCYNLNKKENGKNGLLYNWFAASSNKIAPKGWRVPTHDEQLELQEYLLKNGQKYNYDASPTGNKIGKAMSARTDWTYKTTDENGKLVTDTIGMVGNNLHTNNKTGFNALPVGSRWHDGSFHALTWSLYMWSSTAYQSGWEGWHTSIHTFGANHGYNHHDKKMGFSIRLIKDK